MFFAFNTARTRALAVEHIRGFKQERSLIRIAFLEGGALPPLSSDGNFVLRGINRRC